jgi:hypothetical protein
MKRKTKNNKEESSLKNNLQFCTECGEDLTNAGIESLDIKALEARHKKCKETGKFKGDKCSMLFIAQDDVEIIPTDEDE